MYSKVLTIADSHVGPKYDNLYKEICEDVQNQQRWLKPDYKSPLQINQVVRCIANLLKYANVTVKEKFNLSKGIWVQCCHICFNCV